MVSLQVVVDVDLPVALDDVVAPLHELHLLDVVAGRGDFAGDSAKDLSERGRLVVEIRKDERSPLVNPDGHQPEVGLVEIFGALHLSRDLQPSIKTVGPAMVGTLK